jgi:hypothetical protein
MTTASRSLATALWRARFASGLLPPAYTTSRDTTLAVLCWGSLDEAAARTKVNRIANEQESTKALTAIRRQFWREMRGMLGSYGRTDGRNCQGG